MVHERRLESDCSAGSSLAVNPQASRASPLSRRSALRDDEIHRNEDLFLSCRRFGEPDPRLDMTAGLRLKVEPGGGHRSLELRRILEKPGVQNEITVCRVGSDSEIGGPRVEIDGLRPGQDDSVNVGGQRCQGIEEDTPRDYISLVELKWLRDIICAAHRAPSETRRSSIEDRRQRGSFSCIHEMSASPSAGMRPLPVRQSTAACDGAT